MWAFIGAAVGAFVGAFAGPFAKQFVEFKVSIGAKSEIQKDADVEEFCFVLDGLKNDCFRYWAKSSKELGDEEVVLRPEIQGKLHYINLLSLQILSGSDDLEEITRKEIGSLISISTGGDFGEDNRAPFPAKLTTIATEIYSLKRNLRKRRRAIKPKFFS